MVQYLEVEYFHPCLSSMYIEAFSYLEGLEEQPYIPIIVNSYGGYTDCLNVLRDLIEGSSKPVFTIATGVAMSCGFGLFCLGTKGLRIASPSTTFLLHQVSGMSWGKASDMESENKEIQRLNNELLYKLYDKVGNHPEGYTKNLVKENFNADLYLTADEMLRHNWADKIMPVNQALLNLDNIFDDYKKMNEAIELSNEIMPSVYEIEVKKCGEENV